MPHKERIDALVNLGMHMKSEDEAWTEIKERAASANPWFTPDQVERACNAHADLLTQEQLTEWMGHYPTLPEGRKTVGIVMAGNIPLVGFHDWLCGYLSGQHIRIKLSSKDALLLPYLTRVLAEYDPAANERIEFSDMLQHCDAYIATGSNNSSRYFEQYFAKYPHIIRKNRTSVAVLDGLESGDELIGLADDIFLYYGLGCRNVTQIAVPEGYDFTGVLDACKVYAHYMMHHKYKNNYDYYLTLYLMNNVAYYTNDNLLMVANDTPYSPISVLHYRYYADRGELIKELQDDERVQTVVAHGLTPFGKAQYPRLLDYADGVDTMSFLTGL